MGSVARALLFSSFLLPGRFGDILSYTPGASATALFMEDTRSNGLTLTREGQLLAATLTNGQVTLIDLSTKMRSLYGVLPENELSDIAVRSDGTAYVSVNLQGVYRVVPALGADQEQAPETGDSVTGLALSPDESELYVGVSPGFIDRYPIKADGRLGEPERFASSPGNDMVFDCAGNLYAADLASGTVLVFDPGGQAQHQIDVAGRSRGLAFGGPERKTLFITGERLHAIELNVPGQPF